MNEKEQFAQWHIRQQNCLKTKRDADTVNGS